jgi:hypothetical protein
MTDVTPVILSNNKQAFLYVYGRIVYTDITGLQQTTNFCFRHAPDSPKDLQMERYGSHNYAT